MVSRFDPAKARVFIIDSYHFDFQREQIDVEMYVRTAAEARANCIRLGAYNHYGYVIYPSKVAPVAPGCNLDYVREFVEVGKKYGVSIIGYINAGMDAVGPAAREEFLALDEQGNPRRWGAVGGDPDWSTYFMCPNNPGWLDYVRQITDEVMERGVIGTYFDETIEPRCFCPICRQKYRERFGKEMPPSSDWNQAEFWEDPVQASEYLTFRCETLLEFRQALVKHTHQNNPDALAMINCGGFLQTYCGGGGTSPEETVEFIPDMDGLLTEAQIRCSGQPIWHASENALFADHLPFRPWVHVEYGAGGWPFSSVSQAELIVKTGMLVARGARPALFNYHLRNPRGMEGVKKAFSLVADNEDILENTKSVAEVAVVFHRCTARLYGRDKITERYEWCFRGMHHALASCHTCFDVLYPRVPELDKLKNFRLIVLPSIAILSDAEQETIRHYVREGGNLLVTGEIATHDSLGNLIGNSGLSDVLGCHITGRAEHTITIASGGFRPYAHCYAHVLDRHPALSGFEVGDYIPLSAWLLDVELTTGKSLASTIRPPDHPPMVGLGPEVSFPSILLNQFGKGRVVYLPSLPGRVYFEYELPDVLMLISSIVRWLLDGKPTVQLEAPCTVEMSLRWQEHKERYILHLIDWSGSLKTLGDSGPITVSGIVRLPERFQVADVGTLDGKPVSWNQRDDGSIQFEAPVNKWQALVFQTG